MKEMTIDPRIESSCILDQDVASRYALYLGIGARGRHLCVVCALRKHDFEERAPDPEPEGCEAVPLAKARIDGLPYRSVYHLASRGISCTDCGERVLMTYDPELAVEKPIALYTP